jgi:hypothetical protein
MKSHLGKFAATMRDCDPDGVWNLAQRIWLEHGIAILIPSDVERKKGWVEAQSVKNIAENCYGKSKGG